MSPFYTTHGDSGDTGILGPGRVSKTSVRIEAVGSVDEANAALGLARGFAQSKKTQNLILTIQKQLYFLMSELSADPDVADQFEKINDAELKWVENEIAKLEEEVELPREFIIPGDNLASGALDLARTIVRRAERRTIALYEEQGINKQILIAYLNRLSSLLFMLEIFESNQSGSNLRLAKEA